MALTAEQQTQATQLSNAVPWVYPSVSNAGFWDNYFSGSGPSLTPAEQASGISMGPMTASPAPQPQVLPGFNPDFVGPPSPQPAMPPAPAPAVPYQSELIRSLRQASPGFGSNNPGVTMLANPANSSTVIDFQRTVRPGLLPPPAPAPAPVAPPAPAPAPVSGGGGGGEGGSPPGGGGPITIGPITPLPRIDVVPGDDFVGPMPDDFVGPMPDDFVGPMPDDFVGPPAPDDDGAQPFPVPDPAPPDAVDLPSLPPGGDDDFVGPMPDDFVGPMPDDFVGPMPDDFVGPPDPEYDEIPEGEIEVGAPGSSQLARDAINRTGNITEVGDPLDEWDWIELEEPEIPLPDIPRSNSAEFGDFNFSDADLLDMLFGDFGFGGGGGGVGGSMNMLVQE